MVAAWWPGLARCVQGARYPRHDTERPSPDNGLTVPDSAGTDQKISPQQILDNQARRYPNKRERGALTIVDEKL